MGFIVKAVSSVVKAVVGVVGKVIGGVFGFLIKKPKNKTAAPVNNLNKELDPEANRKIVFGKIAAPLDVRFWEVWGSKGEKFDEVIAVATHTINSFQELYVEKDLAINAAGVIQTKFTGVLAERYTRTGAPGLPAMTPIGAGAQWTVTAKFTGCAHFALRWVPDEVKLPNGIPNRYTQVVEGALVYDPRRDSTVPGGSGTHRYNDQTTWAYATLDGNGVPIGRNNALQALWYLIGWRIQNPSTNEQILVAGRGVDITDINLASFIAGANACETAGYYTDMTLSTEADHSENEDLITCDGLIGRLIDPGGLWSYYANVNDTANIAVTLTDADVLDNSAVEWEEWQGLSAQFNQVGGKFINPSAISLYQAFPYPLVRDATYESNLGIKRRVTQDFRQVLDNTLAQRLARLKLNEAQYQGELVCSWNYKALRAQAWSIVQYQSDRFGWTKLFRVWRHEISAEKGVQMTLREVHSSIWTAGTVTAAMNLSAADMAAANSPISVTGAFLSNVTVTGSRGDAQDGIRISWDAPGLAVRETQILYKPTSATVWQDGGTFQRDVNFAEIYRRLLPGTSYDFLIRHISVLNVVGPWITPTGSPITVGVNDPTSYNNVYNNYPNILFNGGFRLGQLGWTNWGSVWGHAFGADGVGGYVYSGSNGTNVLYSDQPWFAIVAGQSITLQADMFASNVTAGDFRIDIEWINSSNVSLGSTSSPLVIANLAWVRRVVVSTAPAGTAYGRVRIYGNGIVFSAGGVIAARRIKVSVAGTDSPFSDEATDDSQVLSRPGGYRRLGDGRNLNTNWNFGITQLRSSPGFTDTWVAGPPGTVTINIAASSYNSDWGTTINLPSGTIPGCAPNTKYYIYRNQPDPTTAGTSYGASVNLIDALGVGKSYLGYWTTRDSSGGAGGGGGFGNGDCVNANAFVLAEGCGRIASHIECGHTLTVLDEETMAGVTSHEVESNKLGKNDRIRLTSASGIQLTLAVNTPITLRHKGLKRAFEVLGEELPVLDRGKFRWEEIVKIEVIGYGDVAHIVCGQKTFAAGDQPNRYILTHNQVVYK